MGSIVTINGSSLLYLSKDVLLLGLPTQQFSAAVNLVLCAVLDQLMRVRMIVRDRAAR
jgi:hypothetical protein